MTEYWFAQRFPIGYARRGMAPVHWKGWLVALGFVVGMLGAGGFAAWFVANDRPWKAIASFAFRAFMLGLWFIGIANKKGDHARAIADYREDKPRV